MLRGSAAFSLVGRLYLERVEWRRELEGKPVVASDGRLCYCVPLMEEKPVVSAPVNWEAVRMLALTVGVRESARRCGLSEEAVKKRCTREGWLVDPSARESARASVQLRSQLSRPAPASGIVPILSPAAPYPTVVHLLCPAKTDPLLSASRFPRRAIPVEQRRTLPSLNRDKLERLCERNVIGGFALF